MDAQIENISSAAFEIIILVAKNCWLTGIEVTKMIPDILFVRPLRTLYLNGPQVFGYGGWEGIVFEDICAQLTHVPASVWRQEFYNCEQLVERKFQTLLVTVSLLSYCLLLYKILSYLWFRFFIVGPILYEIQKLLPLKLNSV